MVYQGIEEDKMPLIVPRGSILLIEAKDLLNTPPGSTLVWNKVTEHNRSSFTIETQRLEKATRMSNGTMRKYFVADKRVFNVSWSMLPSYRTLTVDGAWGAEDLRSFYNSTEGRGAFNIRINFAKNGASQESSGFETANVMFTSCSFTVVKRGLQPHWDVSLTMEEV
jgi:hypothetical protein